ncbi:autotransporter outer membrane beta-barrel domain-containing protein [Yersinia aleksiciae]|uniref:autotransporter outer membrane beta-barrel domain-containing protein n=1 Tax=Yersinia aleksiciae TaxID=263819 RepID=UPI00119D34DB|nr:autotransporter outer membrane beta-barrel domain-containing protein [Yersinia aleksiciae]
MSHRKTLNTRLLPLSILISSLVSGGAMAAAIPIYTKDMQRPTTNQYTTAHNSGEFTRTADAGSIYMDHGPTVSTHSPADVLLEDLFPADGQITPEIIAEAKFQIEAIKASNEQHIKEFEALVPQLTPEEQKQAPEELAKIRDVFAINIKQYEAALAYAEDQSDENKNKLNAATKDAFVAELDALASGKFTPEDVDLLFSASLTKDITAIPPALQQKFKVAKQAQRAADKSTQGKLANYLAQDVITQEQKDKLDASFSDKKAKLVAQVEAKQAQEAAAKANIEAKADEFRLGVKSIVANTKAENAKKEQQATEDKLTKCNDEKAAAITAVDSSWSENTPDLEKELQDLINDSSTAVAKRDLAIKAQLAIANADAAKQSAQKATTEHDNAEKSAQEIKAKSDNAKQAKTSTVAELADKTREFEEATNAVVNLSKVTDPAADMPVFEQILTENQTQTVASDTAAFGTKIAGGTQDVADEGKILGSIVTDDGIITLAVGAEAFDTVITEGTMSNNGGTDTQTLVGAQGQLALKGTSNTEVATSIDAVVAKGGIVTAGVNSQITTMVSKGHVTAENGAFISNATINGGEFNVQAGATANDTLINDGKFNLMARAQAHKLTIENGYALIAGTLKDATFNGGTAIFDKTAIITGTLDATKNSSITVHDGADTQDADLILAGNLQLVAADASQVALHRAAMTNPAQFAFKNVTLDGGTVDMSSTDTQLTMNSLAGDGTFILASSLYNQANAPLNVTGNADGTFSIQIKDNGVAPTNLKVIDVQGVNAARFALSNGPVNLGNYQHTLVSDGKGGYKLVADTTALTPSTAGVLAVANTLPVIFNAELSSIQNRLDKQSTSANESGVWINYLNDNFDVKGTAANFKQKLNAVTLGGDKAIALGDSVLSLGGFASHSSSDIKSDYQSSGSVESNSLGAYAQYLTNNGYYLNGVLKTNQFKQKLNITSNGNNANGSANFSGLGLAVKAGKHINFDAMYVSPYIALNTFASGKSQYPLSNGMDVQNQGSRNTTGTLGMNTGYRFILNSGAEIKPYAIFSVDRDLKASNNVTINNETFDNSRKGTRVNAGAGINVNMTKNLSVGSEVKLSKGKNISTPVTINLGVGYTF